MPTTSLRFALVALALGYAASGLAQAQDGGASAVSTKATRVVTGLSSANELINDLKHIVVELAGKQAAWDNTLYDSIDVFLIGVDPERPVGVDLVFDPDEGTRKQFQVPLADLTDFLEGNLEPIDIQSRRRGVDLYELHSDTLEWDGFLRIVDNYASISGRAEDVPAKMSSPRIALDRALKSGGYDAGAMVENTHAGMETRSQGFQKFRENMLAGIKKRTTETNDEFTLRKRLAEQQLERFERVFVQGEKLNIGWTADIRSNVGNADLALTALSGTELASLLDQFGAKPSYFTVVPTGPESVLSLRVNIPLDDFVRGQFSEFYQLSAPVWKHRIDTADEIPDGQKTARKQIVDALIGILDASRELDAIDSFVEIVPESGEKHSFLFGARTADGTQARKILEALPNAFEDWSVEFDVDTVEEASVHRVKFASNLPPAAQKFYGGAGEVYVALRNDSVWISGGTNSLDRLKEMITLVKGSSPEADGNVFHLSMRMGVILGHLDDIAAEEGFDLREFLGRPQVPADETEDAEEGERRRPGQAISNFDWRGEALPVLRGASKDRMIISLQRQEGGGVSGRTQFEQDILRAAGTVIAEIAQEKLGQ